MARKKKSESNQQPIEQYEHKDKQRLNNPPVGLVDSHTDNGAPLWVWLIHTLTTAD